MMESSKRQSGEKERVVVAIDESECSHYALKWALDHLSHTMTKSDVILFTAQSLADLAYVYASSMGVAPPELIMNLEENQKKIALALLEKAKQICQHHGIIAETLTEAGDPKDKICETVEKVKANLLIVGSHSRGPIHRAFLGSVSNYCVHNAKCPVLVVRKPSS